jgi:hypothetical protein
VAVRLDGLSGFRKILKDHPFPIPKHSAHHFNFNGEFTCRHSMRCRFDHGS